MSMFRRTTVSLVAAALMGLTTVAIPHAAATTTEADCSLTPTGGSRSVTRSVGGRAYNVFVPAGLTGPAVPLLLSLHGNGEGAALEETNSGWDAYAASKHFIVAYPIGTGLFLNWDYAKGSPDIAYLRNVVADISATWCIDPHRVHATGYSNGGVMAERLACDASDVFASVTALAASSPTYPTLTALFGSPCVPPRPIAVGIFQGILDPISSYLIGLLNLNEWIRRNGCPSTGVRESGVLIEAVTYGPCRNGVKVVWRVYEESHNWPVIPRNRADIHDRMWNLFTSNPLP